MFQISKASDYALLFLSHLLRQPEKKWSVREASETLNISQRFLANIVHQLAKHHLVVTQKGTNGGVWFTQDPSKVSLLDVIEVFEGPLHVTPCRQGPVLCESQEFCSIASVLGDIRKDMVDILQQKTLQDLGGSV